MDLNDATEVAKLQAELRAQRERGDEWLAKANEVMLERNALGKQNDRYEKALREAAVGFASIVDAEVSEGRRNSFVAQEARGNARRIEESLSEGDEP